MFSVQPLIFSSQAALRFVLAIRATLTKMSLKIISRLKLPIRFPHRSQRILWEIPVTTFLFSSRVTTQLKQKFSRVLKRILQKQYPDNNFVCLESNSVDASMGFNFLLKCLTAVAIASILMVLYVTIRFKKIGGLSAGVMALVALFHDVAMIYFLYVIFQMPIDSNFIAVVLMILGYSLNDTIVIYDRVREERKILGRKADAEMVFNLSCTKTIKRTVMTTVTTLSAILVVYIVAVFYNIASVQAFALPMMIGLISGCYSSICIAGPLWVMWQNHKKSKKASK